MKIMTALSLGAAALAFLGTAAAKDEYPVVTKTLDLKGFEQIDVSGVYDMKVRVGPAFSIELSGREYEMARVEASVKNGVLRLDQRDRTRDEKKRYKNDQKGVDAEITLPRLSGIDISGVVDGVVTGVKADRFEVHISGVGDITLDGECGELDARVSGVGDLDADALECRIVTVRVSGVGDASVFASEEVDARVSGMGGIDVYGSPEKVSKSDSMFSEVTVH